MTVRDAPISRDLVDVARPWLRAALGIFFVGYSANSTILIAGADLMFLFKATRGTTIGGYPDAYWYAALFALVLFLGEVACGEKYATTYRIFLIPDALYTARGLWQDMSEALMYVVLPWIGNNATGARIIGLVVAAPISFLVGYLIAKYGEVLLFGKRRVRRAKEE